MGITVGYFKSSSPTCVFTANITDGIWIFCSLEKTTKVKVVAIMLDQGAVLFNLRFQSLLNSWYSKLCFIKRLNYASIYTPVYANNYASSSSVL